MIPIYSTTVLYDKNYIITVTISARDTMTQGSLNDRNLNWIAIVTSAYIIRGYSYKVAPKQWSHSRLMIANVKFVIHIQITVVPG